MSLTATVLRDAQWQEIKRQQIVPGDIVRLSAGDLVPADGQLLEARDLYVQQAALTGESMPAEKEVRAALKGAERTPQAPDLVFLGTSVVSGTGVARMMATGTHPAFGAIAERLADRPSFSAASGTSVYSVIDFGDAAERILAHVETVKANLIGLGVRRAGEITTHFPHTVAYRVLLGAHCPVLTARA